MVPFDSELNSALNELELDGAHRWWSEVFLDILVE